jgi:hypothetical protein
MRKIRPVRTAFLVAAAAGAVAGFAAALLLPVTGAGDEAYRIGFRIGAFIAGFGFGGLAALVIALPLTFIWNAIAGSARPPPDATVFD